MSDREAFWDAICAESEDDAPRLVYADWLDDHHEHARAELIRVQCALAHLTEADADWWTLRDRERALLDTHRSAWQDELPDLIRVGRFVRGFPAPTNGASARQLLASADEFHAAGPIDHLWVDIRSRHAAALMNSRGLDRVNNLGLGFSQRSAAEVFQVLTSFQHPRLTALSIFQVDLGLSGVARLASWPGLNQLRILEIRGNRLAASDYRPLFESPNVGQLRRLEVVPFEPDEAASDALFAASAFRTLEELELTQCSEATVIRMANLLALPALRSLTIRSFNLGVGGANALARCVPLASLGRLTIQDGNLGSAGVRALATSPYLSGLAAVSFEQVKMGDGSLSILANSGFASRLRELTIAEHTGAIDPMELFTADLPELRCLTMRSNSLTTTKLAGLASASWASGLRVLAFEGDTLGDEAARILADTPLSSLRSLDLSGFSFGEVGVAILLRAGWISGLRRLRLNPKSRPLSGDVVTELCKCPHLSRLWKLTVWCEERDEKRLRYRFGKRFINDNNNIPF